MLRAHRQTIYEYVVFNPSFPFVVDQTGSDENLDTKKTNVCVSTVCCIFQYEYMWPLLPFSVQVEWGSKHNWNRINTRCKSKQIPLPSVHIQMKWCLRSFIDMNTTKTKRWKPKRIVNRWEFSLYTFRDRFASVNDYSNSEHIEMICFVLLVLLLRHCSEVYFQIDHVPYIVSCTLN